MTNILTSLDQEIEAALDRAVLSDRMACGSYGAGHDRGYYEGLLRAKQMEALPGGVVQLMPRPAPAEGTA